MNDPKSNLPASNTRAFLTIAQAQQIFVRCDDPGGDAIRVGAGIYELVPRTINRGGRDESWQCLRGSDVGLSANIVGWMTNPAAPSIGGAVGQRVRPDASQYKLEHLTPAEVEERVVRLRGTADASMAQARLATGFGAQTVYRLACAAYVQLSAYLPLNDPRGMAARFGAVKAAHRAGDTDLAWLRERFCREGMTDAQFATMVHSLTVRTFITVAAELTVSIVADDLATAETRDLPPGTYELEEPVTLRDSTSGQWRFLRGRTDLAVSVAIIGLLTCGEKFVVIGEKTEDISRWKAELEELTPAQVSERVAKLQLQAGALVLRAYRMHAYGDASEPTRRRLCREAREAYAELAAYEPYGTELGEHARRGAITMAFEEGRKAVEALRGRFGLDAEPGMVQLTALIRELEYPVVD